MKCDLKAMQGPHGGIGFFQARGPFCNGSLRLHEAAIL